MGNSFSLSEEQMLRYSRQIILPEVGGKGQAKLLEAKVLVVGAGGLGSPASYYLAAAGIGKLGIIDADNVDISNLQRQIIHSTADIDKPKTESAARTLKELNPSIEIETYNKRINAFNAEEIIGKYDLVVDGCDNFATRFLVNDACILLDKPYIYGSVFRFEGQASVFMPRKSGCYRCLFPEMPPAGAVPSCQEAGVMGVVPGIIGLIQATEAIKVILESGDTLQNRLLLVDALRMKFTELKFARYEQCRVCGEKPTILELDPHNYPDESCSV